MCGMGSERDDIPESRETRRSSERAARGILARLRVRAEVQEGIGILQGWRGCDRRSADDELSAVNGVVGRGPAASRLIRMVDAAACGRDDPDAGWD
jgi:hypothetical protein